VSDPCRLVVMAEPDGGRVWVEVVPLVEYLRAAESRALADAQRFLSVEEMTMFAAFTAVGDALRQIADVLSVISMEAHLEASAR
jgi:hypothetical protein